MTGKAHTRETHQLYSRLLDYLLCISIPCLILIHLVASPYTKVEESFHIQAIHDILSYGVDSAHLRDKYDHFSFPGAVPRTFVGDVVLAGLAIPMRMNGVDGQILGESAALLSEHIKADRYTTVRTMLGLFNAIAILSYAGGVRRAFGRTACIWYLAFQGSQFHVLYYASRTLSNMFAFGICALRTSLLNTSTDSD